MFDAAIEGTFRGLFVHGEDIAQSDPNVKHVMAALGAMELVVVQDLFLNETAKFAHVFLPGRVVPGEGRHLHQRRTPDQPGPRGDEAEERPARVGHRLPDRHGDGLPHALRPPEPDHGRDRFCHTDVRRGFVRQARRGGQHPVAVRRAMRRRVRRSCTSSRSPGALGRFVPTPFVPTDERSTRRFPLILTTGRILSQYNVGAQTRRTANIAWHQEDLLEIHPHDAEVPRYHRRRRGDIGQPSRRDEATCADLRPDADGRRVHHVPLPGHRGERRDHGELRLGDELPGVQGDGRPGHARPPGCPAPAW